MIQLCRAMASVTLWGLATVDPPRIVEVSELSHSAVDLDGSRKCPRTIPAKHTHIFRVVGEIGAVSQGNEGTLTALNLVHVLTTLSGVARFNIASYVNNYH